MSEGRISRRTVALCGLTALSLLSARAQNAKNQGKPSKNAPPKAPTEPRPNILWISAQGISPDLGCYGDPYARTPHLDRLASEGVRFAHAYATAPISPSRSAIITGMYPTAIGTHHMRCRAVPPPYVHCFTEYLRAVGYYCCNNANTDYNFESPRTAWDESNNSAHWRNRPDKNQPFFAVFDIATTHEEQLRISPDEFSNVIRSLTPEERHDPAKATLPPYYPDTPIVRNDWARYYDLMTRMDKQVAAILKDLADDGLAESTIVFFWGDYGRGFPRAKRWCYDSGLKVPLLVRWPGNLTPGSVREELVSLIDLGPTVLSLAGSPIPKHFQGQAFLGKQKPQKPREYVFAHRDRVDETYDLIRAVQDKRFKYIRNFQPQKPYAQYLAYAENLPTMKELRRLNSEEAAQRTAGEVPSRFTNVQRLFLAPEKPVEELYDTQTDPYEVNNLAANPKFGGQLKRLRGVLEDWIKDTKDLGFTAEAKLEEQWRPGGVARVTAEPKVGVSDTGTGYVITLSCPTEGASIAYTLDAVGKDDERWLLYTAPLTLSREELAGVGTLILRVRAIRLGYRESNEIDVTLGLK